MFCIRLSGFAPLVMTSPGLVFVALNLKALVICFSLVLSLRVELHGFNHFFFRLPLWPPLSSCIICYLDSLGMSFVAFPRSLGTFLMCVNFWYGLSAMIFVSTRRHQVPFISLPALGLGFIFTFTPLFFERFISCHRRRLFNRQWGANGAVGVVSGDSFNLRL